jgi:hypothetical protein
MKFLALCVLVSIIALSQAGFGWIPDSSEQCIPSLEEGFKAVINSFISEQQKEHRLDANKKYTATLLAGNKQSRTFVDSPTCSYYFIVTLKDEQQNEFLASFDAEHSPDSGFALEDFGIEDALRVVAPRGNTVGKEAKLVPKNVFDKGDSCKKHNELSKATIYVNNITRNAELLESLFSSILKKSGESAGYKLSILNKSWAKNLTTLFKIESYDMMNVSIDCSRRGDAKSSDRLVFNYDFAVVLSDEKGAKYDTVLPIEVTRIVSKDSREQVYQSAYEFIQFNKRK